MNQNYVSILVRNPQMLHQYMYICISMKTNSTIICIFAKKNTKKNMIHLFIHISQDQNEDTEWNDALRRHNIIPQKEKEITEEDIVDLLEKTVEEKTQGNILI